MRIKDMFMPFENQMYEKWQMGKLLSAGIEEAGIAMLWISDYRGAGGDFEMKKFEEVRENFYKLSADDFDIPIYDFGRLISGKTPEDTSYVLQEILLFCYARNVIPIVIGGSNSLSYDLFASLNETQKNIDHTHISNCISFSSEGKEINDENYLNRIFSNKSFSVGRFTLLGYQRHLNDNSYIDLMRAMQFDGVRLAEMMGKINQVEPFLREADLVTVSCDVVESFAAPFSINPQVNGLNRREICACMKEVGMSEKLKSVGIFNYNFDTKNLLNHQLLAQMIWYLIEGINIQKKNPKQHKFETYSLMIEGEVFVFRRDVFRNLWYFGGAEGTDEWLPCTFEDYNDAKRGVLNRRFLR
ncbi:arginase [Bergeyella porcorum]|uniref:arginase n=1 Tax=Bergeyella porcorum TaxID=1735111 RepID=UPI0035EA5F5D